MKTIKAEQVKNTVTDLVLKANFSLRPDVFKALRYAAKKEKNKKARDVLWILLENAKIARKKKIPICQDTGLPEVYVEIGSGIKLTGDLDNAINSGVRQGYKKGYLRSSVVQCPVSREGSASSAPAVIHHKIVPGKRLKITVVAKGFGSENVNKVKMLKPTEGPKEIKEFVVDCVQQAGPNACPPFFIGVGIGGTQNKATLLAKMSLNGTIATRHKKRHIAKLEKDIFKEVNRTKIGVMGFGGKFTALGVNILTHPTHIAGLPVAVNISCHALRTASKTL